MAEDGKIRVSAETGAALVPRYGERHVTQYLISDSELENLSFINSFANWCFGVGSFLVSWPIGIFIDYAMSDSTTAASDVLVRWVAPVLTILSIAVFGFGLYALSKRSSIIGIIKAETIHKDDQVS